VKIASNEKPNMLNTNPTPWVMAFASFSAADSAMKM